MGRIIYPTLLK